MSEYIIDSEKMPPVARDLILREADRLEVVVRCRDCEYYDGSNNSGWCSVNSADVLIGVLAGGYCNYGEPRKELGEF